MTEQFDPWIRASSLATLLRSHRCADIERRLRQGAALGDIQAKARIAKLRRIVSAEWEGTRYRDDEERDWLVPPTIWKGKYRARLSLSTDEYYSGLLGRSEDVCEAALIGLSFDQQQALDYFGVESATTIINAEVIPAVPQIGGTSASPPENDQAPRSAKAEWDVEGQRVADQLDAEGISKRDVRQHHINERWGEGKGSPYSVAAIIGLMAGKPRSGRPKVSG